ncbi:TnsD family Tn7-like transposition protein [Dyella tabacisoli]|uniref:Uncharacterized protein n=1 Tax=Dyella tabacisoli TaxID=2282381 RepID=A0A369UPR3_9GAMM|nr:TnsD family Tn7-like transposition protein [Dyella tabacisoli]RDD82035.1 hypothetical protein DVJ77_09645 [Dyella tabacisoli]
MADQWPNRRLPTIPDLLPDELLYSWIGRLVTANALHARKDTIEWLFGDRYAIPCIDLQGHLTHLCQVLGTDAPLRSPNAFIETSTLYPYHRPFLSPSRDEAVVRILKEGGAKGLKTIMGRVANRFGATPPLQICARCAVEDMASLGETYWRRTHHLPGVSCCAKHGIALTIQARQALVTDRQKFILPVGGVAPVQRDVGQLERRFARLANEVLLAKLPPVDPWQRRSAYFHALEARGWCRARGGRIDFPALSRELKQHYEDFQWTVHRERLLAGDSSTMAWLRTLLSRPRVSVHPICHLLLIGYLFNSIAAFALAIRDDSDEFSDRSVVAIYPNADDAKKGFGSDPGLAIRDVSLSCRALATMLHRSVTTIVTWRRAAGVPIAERRKWLTPEKVRAVVRALVAGKRHKSIAQSHHVSISTVSRIHKAYFNQAKHEPMLLEKERVRRRRHWMNVTSRMSKGGVNAVRNRAGATYAWLYRHDREWLRSQTQVLRCVPKRRPRVDWATREAGLLVRLEIEFKHLATASSRRRITTTRLVAGLGGDNVRVHLRQMPRLKARLAEMSESVEAFQQYRIDNAVDRLTYQGKSCDLWRVQRAAGIKVWTAMLRRYAQEVIEHRPPSQARMNHRRCRYH